MDFSILSKTPLFKGLGGECIESLFGKLNIKEKQFGKNELMALQDEICNRLIILVKGSVKAEMISPSGQITKVEDIQAPNPLAILFLFGNENRFPVQITALENVSAFVISRQAVLKLLSMNEMILKNYLDISADFATRLGRKLHLMSYRSIRQKMAVYLMELSKKMRSDTIRPDKTRTALAEYFGVSRQSVERELNHMQKESLIEVKGKEISIVNRRELMKMANLL